MTKTTQTTEKNQEGAKRVVKATRKKRVLKPEPSVKAKEAADKLFKEDYRTVMVWEHDEFTVAFIKEFLFKSRMTEVMFSAKVDQVASAMQMVGAAAPNSLHRVMYVNKGIALKEQFAEILVVGTEQVFKEDVEPQLNLIEGYAEIVILESF